jgi:hypothetical protein
MAYEKLVDLGTELVTALGGSDNKTGKANPMSIEGYYLGSKNVQTTNGPSVIHVFQTAKGNQGVWGTKKLNDNLTSKVTGKMTLVEYTGKVKIAGGKTQHTYNIMVDKTNVIEVPDLQAGSSDAGPQNFDGDNFDQDTNDYQSNSSAALTQANDLQAKVAALRAKGKVK